MPIGAQEGSEVFDVCTKGGGMNEKTGGPAFPSHGSMGEVVQEGMTLRDYFAAKALPSAYAWALTQPEEGHWELTASEAYNMADAMLKARAE